MPVLPSDELGEKGESRFRELCADAKIICNKADRDRAGWDFIVEFPFEKPDQTSTLDKRPPPISCRVQVKTINRDVGKIKVRLSGAERLAKEPGPAFICVLEVGDDLIFDNIYMIHLSGRNLERILKRLREAHKAGDVAINKSYITFDLKKESQKIAVSGAAFRDSIVEAVGKNPIVYVDRKRDQLETIGFDQSRFIVKTTLKADSYEDLVDAFLGLKDVQYETFESFERRFGIELPFESDNDSTIKIQPNSIEKCQLKFRSAEVDKPVVLSADLFVPAIPVASSDQYKMLVKNEFVQIVIRRTSAQITTVEGWDGARPLSYWSTLFRLRRVLASEKIDLNIITSMGTLSESSINIKSEDEIRNFYGRRLRQAENLTQLLDFAGIEVGPQPYSSFCEIVGELSAFGHAARKELDVFQWKAIGSVEKPPEMMLYVGSVCAFDMSFAFSLMMNIEWMSTSEELIWRARDVNIRRIERIDNVGEAFEAFADSEKVLAKGAAHFVVAPEVVEDRGQSQALLQAEG